MISHVCVEYVCWYCSTREDTSQFTFTGECFFFFFGKLLRRGMVCRGTDSTPAPTLTSPCSLPLDHCHPHLPPPGPLSPLPPSPWTTVTLTSPLDHCHPYTSPLLPPPGPLSPLPPPCSLPLGLLWLCPLNTHIHNTHTYIHGLQPSKITRKPHKHQLTLSPCPALTTNIHVCGVWCVVCMCVYCVLQEGVCTRLSLV